MKKKQYQELIARLDQSERTQQNLNVHLNNEIENLRSVHKASADLMMNIGTNHQDVEDCLRAMRFLFSANAEAKPFIVGIEKILEHQENLKRVAMSYHTAVASVIEEAQKE